jgi:hypothetical protein
VTLSDTTPSVALVLALAAMACSQAGGGDAAGVPPANAYGTGSRLHEIIGPASWLDPSDPESLSCAGIPPDREVNVTGVTLLSLDDFDETGSGAVGNLYVQDTLVPPVPYSGVTVFGAGFSPPDLRVLPGDVLDVRGFLTEFPGPNVGPFDFCRTLPEVSGAVELRFEGSELPANPIPIADLGDYATARAWFGMLVTIEQVTLLEAPFESGGRYSIRIDSGNPELMGSEIPTINNELFDLKAFNEELGANGLLAGKTLQSVTGIVTFFYGVHVAPRSAADIVL